MLAKLPAHRTALFAAADCIEKFGLAKNDRGKRGGPMCLHGAIACAVHGDPEAYEGDETIPLIRDYLRAQGVGHDLACDSGCAPWSNAPERTAAEVADALRNAATWGL